MPAKFDDDLIWVAADTPLSDSTFLSNKIKDLCGELPIFWLRPTYSTSKQSAQKSNILFFIIKQRGYGSNDLEYFHLTSQLLKRQKEKQAQKKSPFEVSQLLNV